MKRYADWPLALLFGCLGATIHEILRHLSLRPYVSTDPGRIKIINGNTCQAMTANIDASAQSIKFPGTEIVTVQPQRGPESIESFLR